MASKLRLWALRLVKLAAFSAVAGLVALLILYWMIAPQLADVQKLRDVELQVPMSVYSQDGKLMGLFGENRRYPVEIEKVPAQVKNAFIAIEDARFYQHHGVDWKGIARAVWLELTTEGRVPGGSTITMQVANNFYLSSEYSYTRKLRQILLAIKMEQELSKEEIFELYLNKIFFGNRSYGVAAAAEFYYGKSLDQLTLAQAAMLAGVPKFPSTSNPLANPRRALERRDYILERMRVLGYITPEQEQAAKASKDDASPHEPRIELEAPYVAEMVRQAMEQRYGADAETQGYRVTTTLRSEDQIAANRAVRDGLLEYDRRRGWRGVESHVDLPAQPGEAEIRGAFAKTTAVNSLPAALVLGFEGNKAKLRLQSGAEHVLDYEATKWTGRAPNALLKRGDIIRLQPLTVVADAKPAYQLAQLPLAQAALVSLQHEDGALRALVGGLSYSLNQFNRATQARRQPGSSFKPMVYAASFEKGYNPASIVVDGPVVFRDRRGEWRPQNEDGRFFGAMRLREALVQSRNLVSVRLLDTIGLEFARTYISQFGIPKEDLPPNLSMSLGTTSLPVMSMARAYTVFSNGGFLVEPYFIQKVEDRHGTVVAYQHPGRACAFCAERLQTEERSAVLVDGFDFSPGGPQQSEAGAKSATLDPDFIGPPEVVLAPRAIDERTAYQIRSMMLDVVDRGTATAAKSMNRTDVGGKTGTTNDTRDAWFSGFGGDLVTTVWVGKDNFKSLGNGEYGGRAALPIWIRYMSGALKDVPITEPALPPNLTATWVARDGRIVPEGTPGAIREYFKTEEYDRISSEALFYQDSSNTDTEAAFDLF